MTDTTIKYFNSSMTSASRLSGTAGDLIGILDACLVNGFGSVTLTSLVVASNVATATCSGGHNFSMVGSTGPVITIAGATPSGLNGEWRVTVTSSTQFTFVTSGITDQTATGTITAIRSPAGWTKLYNGTNKAVYQRTTIGATSMLLRVDDSTTTYASLNAYESMSDVDTGTDGFGGTLYLMKSNSASTSSRPWRIFADAYSFYMFQYWHGSYTTNSEGCFFGDIISYRAATDNYHCAIIADVTNNHPYPGGNSGGQSEFRLFSGGGHYIARSYDQITKNQTFYKSTHKLATGAGLGTSGIAYPSPMNSALLTTPLHVVANSDIRGIMPIAYNPLHNLPGSDGDVVSGGSIAGGEVVLVRLGYGAGNDNARIAMGLLGPSR